MAKRLATPFLRQILSQFNAGKIESLEASQHLQISRAHLYRLKSRWLQNRSQFSPKLSGGDHWPDWPAKVCQFLQDFVPLQSPANFQLVADELDSRFGFKRHRESVAAFVRSHYPDLVPHPAGQPQVRRRWQRAQLNELWQHDSSIHQWWRAADKQTLLLTIDDHSRKLLQASFVPTDTTWNHFEHFRRLFRQHQLPLAVYTDGLSLFGHTSTADHRAKGKIERRFGTLQKRLVSLLAYEKVDDYPAAQELLNRQIDRQNATVCRTTGLTPNEAWDQAVAENRSAARPCPAPALLDLHLAVQSSRRVNADRQIDFLGRSWPIAPTQRKTVVIIHHPHRQFWVVTHAPVAPLNSWPEILGKFSL